MRDATKQSIFIEQAHHHPSCRRRPASTTLFMLVKRNAFGKSKLQLTLLLNPAFLRRLLEPLAARRAPPVRKHSFLHRRRKVVQINLIHLHIRPAHQKRYLIPASTSANGHVAGKIYTAILAKQRRGGRRICHGQNGCQRLVQQLNARNAPRLHRTRHLLKNIHQRIGVTTNLDAAQICDSQQLPARYQHMMRPQGGNQGGAVVIEAR